ncbi:MAG TPA: HAD hydrolase-like protein, partial [Candidatus Megaira endosymbiont of Hartmannula sinica]|nr:HAD hydrolase-like protein [Candidatus Megaera endosymbiont of Hartmannula sinica]
WGVSDGRGSGEVSGVILEDKENYLSIDSFITEIKHSGKDILFVTNSPRPKSDLLKILQERGFRNITEDMLVTSGDVARSVIYEYGCSVLRDSKFNSYLTITKKNQENTNYNSSTKPITIYHLGKEYNTELLHNFVTDNDLKYNFRETNVIAEADIILLSLYRDGVAKKNEMIESHKVNEILHALKSKDNDDSVDLEYNPYYPQDRLEEDSRLIKEIVKSRAIIICSNPDIIVPRFDRIRYCSGYFAAILEKKGRYVIYTGKPKAEIFQKAISLYIKNRSLSASDIANQKRNIIMIGDTIETDIVGANNFAEENIDSCLVLGGNARRYYQANNDINDKIRSIENVIRDCRERPRYVFEGFKK